MAFDPTTLNVSGKIVLWFDDLGTGNPDYNFLSNFYAGEPLVVPGVKGYEFATGEHAFAALKTLNPEQFNEIAEADDPNTAKALGRQCDLRPDWEVVKLDVMAAVVRSKFTLDREEGPRLLATGDAYLCEGTFWNDEVWGVDLTADGTPGRNWLGTLLMARRAELRAQQAGVNVFDTAVHNAAFSG